MNLKELYFSATAMLIGIASAFLPNARVSAAAATATYLAFPKEKKTSDAVLYFLLWLIPYAILRGG